MPTAWLSRAKMFLREILKKECDAMSTKKQTALIVKIIAVVLILASAAMLFLPWMKVTLSFFGQSFDMSKLLEYAAQMGGTTVDSMKSELYGQIQESVSDLQNELGVRVDGGKIIDFFNTILKGAWSPFNLLGMISTVRSIMPPLVAAANASSFYDGPDLSSLNTANSYMNTAYIILLVLVILTLAMAAVAIVCALTDHKGGMIPYLAFTVIMLVLFIVMVVGGNKNSGAAISALNITGDLPFDIGAGLKICIGGILCVVFAVLAFVAMFLPIGGKTPVKAGAVPAARSALSGWRCPGCGTMLRGDQKFCLNCGAKKPEAPPAPVTRAAAPSGWKCPTCGAALKNEQKFCPGCGTKRPEEQAQPVPAAPAVRPLAQRGWKCPNCGAALKNEQKFCPACGTKRPEQEPAPAPVARPAAPSGWKCPTCGTALKNEQKFCPNCGTRRPEQQPAPAPVARPAAPSGWKCPGCGIELKNEQKFCPNCGTRQPEPAPAQPVRPAAPKVPEQKRCSVCGMVLADGMSFCPVCGTPAEPAPAPQPKPAPAESYTPAFTTPDIEPAPVIEPATVIEPAPVIEPVAPAPEPAAPAEPAASFEETTPLKEGFKQAGDDDL